MSFVIQRQAAPLLAALMRPLRRAQQLFPCSILALLAWVACPALVTADPAAETTEFHTQIRPILETYCFDCHGDGARKGNVAFDEFKSDQAVLTNRDLWFNALKYLRAGIMPPAKKPRPSPEQQQEIAQWIKSAVFEIDPKNPDPGRVTVRRLNRAEYRNTIHDLMGVDYDTATQFPPDDTGYGFDTIGDVLTVSPMLLEKYVNAAEKIVSRALPESEKESKPDASSRFFPKPVPNGSRARRAYAHEILSDFTRKAFRRPADEKTVARLVSMAEDVYRERGKTFQAGVGHAMVAVLASPRFLFRQESAESNSDVSGYPLVDEYALASRLSYFLWSSMPDEELMSLAAQGELRKNLPAQLARMLKDDRSKNFVRDFTGQWLRARDVESVQIDDRSIRRRESGDNAGMDDMLQRYRDLERREERLSQDEKDEMADLKEQFLQRFGRPIRPGLSPSLRKSMREETEDVFSYILHGDRSLLELIDSDYTFLNERLAQQYGIGSVKGNEMRLVTLPRGSMRGGVLTESTVLVVTSNPTRTSPVKRGLFILDNILGTPPPPPPPDIPPLEDAAKGLHSDTPTLRETLAAHRAKPLCASCHNRMDPLGLAMENFNALGLWRTRELNQPIDATGTLLTGESFSNIKELKHILVEKHAKDFYSTLTEKMLTYALGRGLDYYDVETVDQIVSQIEKANGRPSALLEGIVASAPFQKCRPPAGALPSFRPGKLSSSSLNNKS